MPVKDNNRSLSNSVYGSATPRAKKYLASPMSTKGNVSPDRGRRTLNAKGETKAQESNRMAKELAYSQRDRGVAGGKREPTSRMRLEADTANRKTEAMRDVAGMNIAGRAKEGDLNRQSQALLATQRQGGQMALAKMQEGGATARQLAGFGQQQQAEGLRREQQVEDVMSGREEARDVASTLATTRADEATTAFGRATELAQTPKAPKVATWKFDKGTGKMVSSEGQSVSPEARNLIVSMEGMSHADVQSQMQALRDKSQNKGTFDFGKDNDLALYEELQSYLGNPVGAE